MNAGDAAGPLSDHLRDRVKRGGPLGSDEIVHLLAPLFQQVADLHAQRMVAPLQGLARLQIAGGQAFFAVDAARGVTVSAAIHEIDRDESRALEIEGHQRVDETAHDDADRWRDLSIGRPGEAITRPVYLPGYVAWEHEVGHHDELTDIFSLGLLLVSAGCGLDLSDDDDLRRFVGARANLFVLNRALHPVIAKLALRMTALQRRRRAQDLHGLLDTLRRYREQRAGSSTELTRVAAPSASRDPRAPLLAQLRDRLFELTRRNRLLYFKPTLGHLNLTVASVPLLLDYKAISPDALFTWRGDVAEALSRGRAVPLGRYLRFEDAAYLPGVLDRIRAEERRDRAEFGFSQLRLALCLLRWHNLKEDKHERITSPLVLLPVQLEKRKGVRDSYVVTPTETEAEVNPVLRHQLRQLYGLDLPETIDLEKTSLTELHERLQGIITASEPGITLRLIERPHIKLVHERARLRLEQFRRRERLTGRGIRRFGDVDYCYARDNFQPLGLQLFIKVVRPSPAPRRDLVDRPNPRPLPLPMSATGTGDPGGVVERDAYVLQSETEGNPYLWDFDLCNVTLGNFNYRKMTLVRDYNQLAEQGDASHPAFDAILSFTPRPTEEPAAPPLPLRERFSIVDADPTQETSIARARLGGSYIIQGPPGTGKSQTITNLIADYVARGRRVLFVCEKRAAIDVVFHRLKQVGLDRLCALIHDSQADKKAFIQDLKATYERYLATPDALEEVARARTDAITRIEAGLDVLGRASDAMTRREDRDAVEVRRLFARLVELAPHIRPLSDAEAERMPAYRDWLAHAAAFRSVCQVLRDLGGEEILARHPVAGLSRAVFQEQRPLETVTRAIQAAEPALDALDKAVRAAGFDAAARTLGEVAAAVTYADSVRRLADLGLLRLLERSHRDVRALRAAVRDLDGRRRAAAQAAEATKNWREKLPAGEVGDAIALARSVDGALGFVKPAWWRLRKLLNARYDFSAHAIKPSWTRILEALRAEYDTAAAVAAAAQEAEVRWGTGALDELGRTVDALHAGEARLDDISRALRERLLADDARAGGMVNGILAAAPALGALAEQLGAIVTSYEGRTLLQAKADLARLRGALGVLPDLVPPLRPLAADAPDDLWAALRATDLPFESLEAAVLQAALLAAHRRDRGLQRVDGPTLAMQAQRVAEAEADLRRANAAWVLAHVHSTFRKRIDRAGLPAEQLDAAGKKWKKEWARGRRELEHEFSKVMRYRSIRDLAGADTGLLLADLKPIWLMSPLSVSDTLPLDDRFFDVVIYDEASQIPLEEAVPALYRGPQAIVVGDRQQLPPTDFFSAKAGTDDEDDGGAAEADDGGFELDSDSFLTQAAGALSSTLLGWHYRSKSEALISFSNAAFYEGRLLTIPDRVTARGTSAIAVAAPAEGDERADAGVDAVLDRPVSYHLLDKGLYLNRRNAGEAAYVARLVRGLLRRKTGLSLGVVAFSQAQQDEIEGALAALAREDEAFGELLEAEQVREEDDQFCGLFVKNLENVQGDERDVIIISICYGPGPDGKMLMNFGPINKAGGERRLNVVFSRARRHMVVVSSIRHTAITNEYNDGANCLRRYLEYAAAMSGGDGAGAGRVLDACCPARRQSAGAGPAQDPAVLALAAALRGRGYEVDVDVGASHLRCDVAIRRRGAPAYDLGLLVDTPAHYRVAAPLERYVQRPGVLASAGWQTLLVLAKDLHDDLPGVLRRVDAALKPPPRQDGPSP
jgi:hypothetical protein